MVTTDGTQVMVKGIGAHIWGTSDQFEFVYQHCVGDCTIIARVTSLQNTDQWAKGGVMLRETPATRSRQVDVIVSPSKGKPWSIAAPPAERRRQRGRLPAPRPGGYGWCAAAT